MLDLKQQIKKQEAIIVKYKDEHTNPIEFVEQCSAHQKLKQMHKNWQRKIEIAELEGKKARAILKKNNVNWQEEMGMADPHHQLVDNI